jgi:hypothetical protein
VPARQRPALQEPRIKGSDDFRQVIVLAQDFLGKMHIDFACISVTLKNIRFKNSRM